MSRISLDLNKLEDQQKVNGRWKVGYGLVPGEPNEGLVSRLLASPARLADYDDAGWSLCDNIRESLSEGFTFDHESSFIYNQVLCNRSCKEYPNGHSSLELVDQCLGKKFFCL